MCVPLATVDTAAPIVLAAVSAASTVAGGGLTVVVDHGRRRWWRGRWHARRQEPCTQHNSAEHCQPLRLENSHRAHPLAPETEEIRHLTFGGRGSQSVRMVSTTSRLGRKR